jgi:hypothetical protein
MNSIGGGSAGSELLCPRHPLEVPWAWAVTGDGQLIPEIGQAPSLEMLACLALRAGPSRVLMEIKAIHSAVPLIAGIANPNRAG